MRVLRGVVHMTKSIGPRTEPWGTPQEDVCQEDRVGEKTLEFSNSVICSVFVPYKYIVTQGLWPCLKIH